MEINGPAGPHHLDLPRLSAFQTEGTLSLNADKGLKEGLRFGGRTKTLLELCERGFQM